VGRGVSRNGGSEMKDDALFLCCIVYSVIMIGGLWAIFDLAHRYDDMQTQAIEKGYAEIRVVDGERKFQWK
jgi:hypothetical protein